MVIKKIELTAEQKAKISKYNAYTIKSSYDYVPKAFRDFDMELRPTFKLKVLKGIDLMALTDKMQKGVSEAMMNIEICKAGIVSYHNLVDNDGYIHNADTIDADALNTLKPELICELAVVITEGSTNSESEQLGLL